METPRHTFNSLPPRPEHLSKTLRAFNGREDMTESEIVKVSGLTKTQALCALVHMIEAGSIERDSSTRRYRVVKFGGK